MHINDKILHAGACAIITLIISVIGLVLGFTFWASLYAGICTSLGAGLAKEYGDKHNQNSGWDWKDILADIIGLFVSTVILLLFYI